MCWAAPRSGGLESRWRSGRGREGKELVARFCEAVRDGPAFQPPLADKRLAAGFHLGGSVGIDHIAVIFAQLVMHVFGSMTQKVAVLVHGAALNGKVIARECQKICARAVLSDIDEPFAEEDGELCFGLEPFPRRTFPRLGRMIENEI